MQYNKENQLYVYIYPFPFGPPFHPVNPTHLRHHRAQSWAPCAMQQLPTATATAKSLQPCPTLCNPIDGSPPGSPIPGILQARALEWVAISFSNPGKWKVKVKSHSRVRLLATPWTTADQAPPYMGFSRQEYWSGVPLPSPQLHTSSLFYTWQCAYANSNLPVYSPTHPCWLPHNLHVCLYPYPANRVIWTIFLDSTHMH